ncbi:monovalent cation/H+ antiporter subunit D [Aliidiomarina celeris]|uniref:monovalent cation/H+ antiporter subunit D n=1 Tax=Aliidiomarina celeris TaxID=2249428 RepID=UPI000DE9B73D|nr:monovalent cation/H+ antiporter subunit D [Aliidiomarina celeris]
MSHLAIAPILLPGFTAIVLIFLARSSLKITRGVSLISAVALLNIVISLLQQSATGSIEVYSLGNWDVPFGIILVVDTLSSFMLLVNAVLVIGAILFTFHWNDERADNLQALIHFLVMGVNGAFLTGDIFNLFVFFEVMLIASYALMLHGGGKERAKAGLHYVLINLVGSSLFILGVGMLYGVVGSLNMADLTQKIAQVPAEDMPLVTASALILLLVFGIKAAILPLYFWLPKAYGSASAPVAALFAIMTKVGIYSIVRVHGMIFWQGETMATLQQWIWPLAIATMVLGAIGVIGARRLRMQLAYTVVVSVGTMLGAFAIHSAESMQALFYYLAHSTWITGALFLLADVIAKQRGGMHDSIVRGPQLKQYRSIGVFFFLGAIALIGMPPLSGFFGKVLLLNAASGVPGQAAYWAAILVVSLITLIALGRAGSTFFWRVNEPKGSAVAVPKSAWLGIGFLFLMTFLMVIFAEQSLVFFAHLGEQVANPAAYIDAVFSFEAVNHEN